MIIKFIKKLLGIDNDMERDKDEEGNKKSELNKELEIERRYP